jgi:hypothetical protein
MTLKTAVSSLLLSVAILTTKAQTSIPAGYVKGSITLPDNTVLTGYVKENIKKAASVTYVDDAGGKKTFAANAINAVTLDAENFLCINGDFFRTICVGKLNFLQKASNAAGNASYNGTEAVFNSGTDGKIGDYFSYANNSLKILNKKSIESFISNELTGCVAAIEKAKSVNGDIAKLKEAVDIYNSSK